MITAIILMNVKRDRVNSIAEQLASMADISEVYSVTGNYDLVALVRAENNDALAALVGTGHRSAGHHRGH